jgi:predicted permease
VTGVLGGFVALAVVIAVGWIVGRSGILGAAAEGVLARLSFFVATPALLFLTLADADPGAVLSAPLLATAGSAVLAALLYALLAWWRWRLPAAELTTGGLASSYVNAGNLGIPVTAYVLGDASYVAPVLLFQVLVMAPIGLAVLAGSRAGDGQKMSRWRLLTQPVRTPVVIGCALGLLFAAVGGELPPLLLEPVELIAALAIPAALLAYGMSLHGSPRPAAGERAGQVWLGVALKTVGQPLLAYALGRWVAGLDGLELVAVTVTSALPTAQNVYVYASSYDRGTLLARDVVMLSTLLSVPVLLVIALVLT